MERRDFVNESLTLIQKTDGLTFGTDALLLAAYISGKFDLGCELGSGSGIISLLLLAREKLARTVCLEVQSEYAELTELNARENGLSQRLTSVNADLRDYKSDVEFDIVYTNPP
jgi:tRNA1Val (adenine37-N6)-methyltransferase